MNLFGDETVTDDFGDDSDFSSLDEAMSVQTDILQPPKSSDLLLGHESIERDMAALWNNGRMPHALVFNGLRGIGKATFAYRLARFILKESSEGDGGGLFGEEALPENLSIPADHPVFSRVASGGHPDLMVVTRPFDERKGQFKDEIPVDDIRKVAPFLRKTSSNGGWRVVIVDDANAMNRNGQNALLKILEEPPKKALLILVTHGAGGLLPTIRSRCRFVSFDPLNNDNLAMLLNKSSNTPAMAGDVDILSTLAEGSAGQAIELYEGGGLEHINVILDALTRIKSLSHDQIDTLALAYGKSGDTKSIEHFTFIMHWWFQCLIHMAAMNQSRREVGHIDLKVPEGYDLQKLLRLHEEVSEHIDTCINGSLDKRYMIYKALRMIQG